MSEPKLSEPRRAPLAVPSGIGWIVSGSGPDPSLPAMSLPLRGKSLRGAEGGTTTGVPLPWPLSPHGRGRSRSTAWSAPAARTGQPGDRGLAQRVVVKPVLAFA